MKSLAIAALRYISACPCDPDITQDQREAWGSLQDALWEYAPEMHPATSDADALRYVLEAVSIAPTPVAGTGQEGES